MTFNWIFKISISAFLDTVDFFMPPGVGTIYDLFLTIVSKMLWGNIGLIQGLELFDITDRIDSFVPSLTIAGLLKINELFE